jgi:hypothetical protein
LDGPFTVVIRDGFPELAHRGPESGFRLGVDGFFAEAAAVLP